MTSRATIRLLPSQHRLLIGWRDCSDAAFVGGLGVGKTHALALFALWESLETAKNYGAVAAATFPQLRRSTIRAVESAAAELGIAYRFNKVEHRMTFANGSQLDFISCDVPAVELQGPEFGWLAVDEAEGVGEAHWQRLAARVRKKDASRRIRVFSNPPPRGHWLVRDFAEGRLGPLIQARTAENRHLPPGTLARYERIYPPGTPAHRRYLLGEIGVPAEGAVYPEFSDIAHVISDEDYRAADARGQIAGFFAGLDFGQNHPTALVVCALTANDEIFVVAEYRAAFRTIAQHAECFREILRDGPIWADTAAAQDRAEYRALGLPTLDAPKEIGVSVGLDAVRARLRTGRLKLLRGATNLLALEFQNYRWAAPRVDGREYREAVVKVDDDLLDALRYAVTGLEQALSRGSESLALSSLFSAR